MSDFDKEAEREKLREKYGRDEDDREATERMSDLLLKGATMTNTHCGTCGDPIFRYEGQEFCPTCQEVVAEAVEDGEETADEASPAEPDATADEVPAEEADTTADARRDAADPQPGQADTGTPRPGENGRADTGTPDAPTGTASGQADAGPETPATDPTTGPQAADDNAPADWTTSIDPSVADAVETEGQSETTPQKPPAQGTGGTEPSGAGDLAQARASLSKTVTRLTAQADASDDLDRTRAYLAAVEEAADALAAVKRADN